MSFIESRADIAPIAAYKRFLEYGIFDPDFREKLKQDPLPAIRETGIDPGYIMDASGNKDTEAARLYQAYVQKKMEMRDRVREESTPKDPVFAKWRKRQIARCDVAFHTKQAEGMVHSCLMFELSSGCSVGCEFCGLNAGPLKKIFRATEENSRLWNDILAVSEEILGPAAGQGALYYATEPLDNPDYEYYMDTWKERYGEYSQITTAAALRNMERTHRILAKMDPQGGIIFRFSVRSREDFRRIMKEFTPEELLLVELLPQFEGAEDNHFARVGRAVKDGKYEGSISCLSGFLVNLCDRTIRLLTPISASAEFPEGQVELAMRTFETAEDFALALREMINGMKTILSPKEKLEKYEYLNEVFDDDGVCQVYNTFGTGVRIEAPGYQKQIAIVMEMLSAGGYTRKEIAEKVQEADAAVDPVLAFSMINRLWNIGIIADEQIETIKNQKKENGHGGEKNGCSRS